MTMQGVIQSIHVSAPGKVLLTGGYLVLDRKYSGLVIGVDSRMHCKLSKNDRIGTINVYSRQFTDGEWSFELVNGQVHNIKGNNQFVHITLQLVYTYLSALDSPIKGGLEIEFMADNDFYSQSSYLASRGLEPTIDNIKQIPKCNATGTRISKVSKTGLGTSATLVATLVAGLLIHHGMIVPTNNVIGEQDLILVDKISQLSHSMAQGKIGSGFDISAACFGSQVYRRFSPTLLASALQTPGDAQLISRCIEQKWDQSVFSTRLPKGIRILLAEVHQGSNTPKMVSKVLEWRNSPNSNSYAIWNDIDGFQKQITSQLETLKSLENQSDYDSEMDKFGESIISVNLATSDVGKCLWAIKSSSIVPTFN